MRKKSMSVFSILRAPTACKTPNCSGHAVSKGFCEECLKVHAAEPESKFDKSHPFRWMYDDPRWKNPVRGLRACQLRKVPICVECKRAPANTADHLIDHRGDWILFLDPNNLRSVCASCHSKKTGTMHGIGNRTAPIKSGLDANGLVHDPMAALLRTGAGQAE
jgi:5-methylcytosine-specific restriction protein A